MIYGLLHYYYMSTGLELKASNYKGPCKHKILSVNFNPEDEDCSTADCQQCDLALY